MLYDCFSFYNELDILNIRLHVLNDIVDKFVIAESTYTHSRKRKPLYFKENESRFAAFKDKIIHIVIDENPAPPENCSAEESAWQLENLQRNALAQALQSASPTDAIIISDCDEIPDPNAIRQALKTLSRNKGAIVRCYLRMYTYFLNLRDCTVDYWTQGTQICSIDTFRNPKTFSHFPYTWCVPQYFNANGTLTQLRFLRPTHVLKKAGWHFSYIGNAEKLFLKINSIADFQSSSGTIPPLGEIKKLLSKGKDILGRDRCLVAEPINKSLPQHIIDHQAEYTEFLLPSNKTYYKSFPSRFFLHIKRMSIINICRHPRLSHSLWFLKHKLLLVDKLHALLQKKL